MPLSAAASMVVLSAHCALTLTTTHKNTHKHLGTFMAA